MKHYTMTALPLLFLAGFLAPGCGDDKDDCALHNNCVAPQGGNTGVGGAGVGGEANGAGGDGTGAAGGAQGQGGSAQGGSGQGGSGGDMMPATCTPWDNAPGQGVPDTCGVFVSSVGAGGDGSQANPYATIGEALATASAGTSIYLCEETFNESVVVPSGVTIYGGLDCTDGWTYASGAKTTLMGLANTIAAEFTVGGDTTTVYDTIIAAADATDPGGSSTAALIGGGTVRFERVDAIAGAGAAGENGNTPTTNVGPSDPSDSSIVGRSPLGGNTLCGSSVQTTGAVEKSNPFCTTSVGGAGGQGQNDNTGASQSVGSPGKVLGGSGGLIDNGYPPGILCLPNTSCGCEIGGPGGSGGSGSTGTPGTGASGEGVLVGSGWLSAVAGDAGRGTHGRGGGGGAGAPSGPGTCGSGGSGGGAGGCGGFGGTAGTSGGGSFAVIVLGGIFSTTGGSLTTGIGGAGGDGGVGQVGGVGGNGGTATRSCSGGKGGDGGEGGVGGGGAGGHAMAVAHTAAATINVGVGTVITLGTPGAGGTGGDANGNGVGGIADQIHELPVP